MNKSHFFKFLLSALITCPLITFAASEPWTIEDVLEVSSELSQQMRDPEVATQKPLPQAFVLVSFSMPEAFPSTSTAWIRNSAQLPESSSRIAGVRRTFVNFCQRSVTI